LPRSLWVLAGGTFINRFGSFVIPFLVLHLTREGITPQRAGLALAFYGFGHLLASLIGGHLADHFGRRNTIALSMFCGALAMLLLSQAREFGHIAMLTGLLGLASEMYRPACSALIADLVPAGERVTAFAVYRLAVNAGFAFGPATAGFLADQSFLWLFLGDAVTSALFGLIALLWLPNGLRADARQGDWRKDLTTVLRDRRFLLFLGAVTPITFVFFQMTSSLPLHVRASGLSTKAYGLLISLNGLIIVLTELPITTFTRRLPARPVMAAGYLLLGFGYALTGFAHQFWTLAGTVVIWTLGEMLSAPVSSAYIADLAPERLRGRYLGMLSFTWSVGLMAGPALGGALYAHHPAQLWITCGALGVLAALMVLASGRAARPA